MRLKYTFEMVPMGDEVLAVAIGRGASQVGGVLKLNKEGAKILGLLGEDVVEEDIVASLAAEYENDLAELASFVHDFVASLDDNRLLER